MAARRQRSHSVRRTLPTRLAVAGVAIGALVLTGCSPDAPITENYTPAAGVNADAGNTMLRALVVVLQDGSEGVGALTGSALNYDGDQITGVTVEALDEYGKPVSKATVTGAEGVAVKPGVLTQFNPTIKVTSKDLKPGLLSNVTVNFAKAGTVKIQVPVFSTANPNFAGVKLS